MLLIHLMGLKALSVMWPTHAGSASPLSLQWQATAPPSPPETAAPAAATRQARPPRPLRDAPKEGFYAPDPAAETTSSEPEPVAVSQTPTDDAPVAQTQEPAPVPAPEAATASSAEPFEPVATPPEPTQATDPPATPAPTAHPASAAPPLTTDNTTAPTWLSQARFVWPRSGVFQYDVLGESKGLRLNANGELVWQHDGVNYQMKLDISHMLLGSRSQTSVGQLGPQGLLPKRFGDKYKQEVAAHFEREKGQVVFSANSTPLTLQVAAQDRLSLFAQLAALLAGSPQLRQAGQQLNFQVVSAKSAEVWSFQVANSETLKLPVGDLTALKVSRLPLQNHDQTADMWLSPAHGYLPVKVRIAQANGDVLEQSLRKVVGQ
ncbi:MAG: DUF3108 domain-containing protein [Limnohabitans sp.]